MTAIASHTTRSSSGEPSDFAIDAGVKKMPSAIDWPTTIPTAAAKPSSRFGIWGWEVLVIENSTDLVSRGLQSRSTGPRKMGNQNIPAKHEPRNTENRRRNTARNASHVVVCQSKSEISRLRELSFLVMPSSAPNFSGALDRGAKLTS